VCWPFCWWVGAVVDQHSRAVLATLALGKEPTAAEVCAMLDRAATAAGRPPRHIISDQGVHFTSADYRAWCDGAGAKPRFGAVGKSGSIAIVERFFRSMKQECFYRILVPLRLDAMRAELGAYVLWYGQHRPHRGLDGSTPAKVLAGAVPVGERPRLEPRARYPLARGDPDGPPAVRCGKLELVVSYVEGLQHLPVFELREAG
jgi:putative transposase